VSAAIPRDIEPAGGAGGSSRRRHAVFISDFVHLDRPFDQLAASLLDPEAEWHETADRSASRQRFMLTAGEARRSGSSVIVPILWEPAALERLLPTLDADIELFSLGDGHCRLSLSGRYRVPLAQIGVAIDRLAMHRLAEAAVRRFLSEIAETLGSG
jgi:hypothetical protein